MFNFVFDEFWNSIYLKHVQLTIVLFFLLKQSCSLLQILIFFVKLWLILSQLELSTRDLPKCKNYDHTIFLVLSILFWYDPVHKVRLFEKFIFELEAFYSFKTSSSLVRQVISLKKSDGAIGKIDCIISWSHTFTSLVLKYASLKMANTSATIIYNNMRVKTSSELLRYG